MAFMFYFFNLPVPVFLKRFAVALAGFNLGILMFLLILESICGYDTARSKPEGFLILTEGLAFFS